MKKLIDQDSPTKNIKNENFEVLRPKIMFYTGSIGENNSLNDYYLEVCEIEHFFFEAVHVRSFFSNGFELPLQNTKERREIVKFFANAHKHRDALVVIPEAHVLNYKTLDKISRFLKSMLNNDEPFGGIRFVFFYDFFQLTNSSNLFLNFFKERVPNFEIYFYSPKNKFEMVCDFQSHEVAPHIF